MVAHTDCWLSSNSRYEQVVLKKKPSAYWRLGESQPPLKDRTANTFDGQCVGAPTLEELGALTGDPDFGVKLAGQSYVEIPSHKYFSQPTSTRGLTVEAWVRFDAFEFSSESKSDNYLHWMGKGNRGDPRECEWALRFYGTRSPDRPKRVSAYIFNPEGGLGAGAYFQDSELKLGEWIHVVACFDPGDATNPHAGVCIYKNGVFRQGPREPGTLYRNPRWQIMPRAGNAPLRLGAFDRANEFNGALDEVAVYPRVLTAAEIRENYSVGEYPSGPKAAARTET